MKRKVEPTSTADFATDEDGIPFHPKRALLLLDSVTILARLAYYVLSSQIISYNACDIGNVNLQYSIVVTCTSQSHTNWPLNQFHHSRTFHPRPFHLSTKWATLHDTNVLVTFCNKTIHLSSTIAVAQMKLYF